ncbi:MAG: hypothetical protein AABW88_04580 [Nanoarchaeota archaeon]
MINASEISSYFYCPVCWWIGRTEGVKITKAIVEGSKHHRHIAHHTETATKSYFALILVFILILFFVVMRFLL